MTDGADAAAMFEQAAADERYSPYRMEQDCKAKLAELLPLREAATDRRERKELSRRIKLLRSMASWARTRAGYMVPEQGA